MGISFSLLRTILPNVRTQNSSGSSIDYMSSSVECSEGISSFNIDFSMNLLADNTLVNTLVQIVKEAFANFLNIVNLIVFSS